MHYIKVYLKQKFQNKISSFRLIQYNILTYYSEKARRKKQAINIAICIL